MIKIYWIKFTLFLAIAIIMIRLTIRRCKRGRVISAQVAGAQAMVGVLPA